MSLESTAVSTSSRAGQIAGKYLTFSLAGEQYGLEILKVREIIGTMNITAVPRTPGHLKGVINLRGKIIPVVDLRLAFEMPEVEATDQTCIVVVQIEGKETGLIIDRVSEVLDIPADQIDDAPPVGAHGNTQFIRGVAKAGECVTILLDIARVLESGAC